MSSKTKDLQTVLEYHETTKHHFDRFAKSAGFMDWANQPHPFRFYEGCDLVKLPLERPDPKLRFDDLVAGSMVEEKPVDLNELAKVLELSFGLSAWKEAQGNQWSLRIHPSSGNLHPIETYWAVPDFKKTKASVYHYNPLMHSMETRCEIPGNAANQWRNYANGEGILFCLSSIHWRESWKYGERAFRYTNLDMGHALAALNLAASTAGWQVQIIENPKPGFLESLFGFHRIHFPKGENEVPQMFGWITKKSSAQPSKSFFRDVFQVNETWQFKGSANQLSESHQQWENIEAVENACSREIASAEAKTSDGFEKGLFRSSESVANVIRRRRSAVSVDPSQSQMTKDDFINLLSSSLPGEPFMSEGITRGEANLNLLIFVHQVEGLEQGLYCLVRNPEHLPRLQEQMHSTFQWSQPVQNSPLYLLQDGDYRGTAKLISCNQDIAGLGTFSLGMLAEFYPRIQNQPSKYKQLFHEGGMIGQMLYLAAEVHGMRATGIGCFFDDGMHDLLGLKDNEFQDLYHFTVGFPVDDDRISTRPAYFHLKDEIADK